MGALLLAALGLAACGRMAPLTFPTPTLPPPVPVRVAADGQARDFTLPAGLTVREALAQAGVALGELDRLVPSAYARISAGTVISVTRVRETFEAEQSVLPFSSQTVKSEALAVGEQRLLQAGRNGLVEITYRIVFEDGLQVSRSVIKRVVLEPPAAEVILVGSQASFTVVPLSGTLAYLNGQNAWLMRENSGQRRPLTFSGDLDGRVFELSADGQWLLFTRVPSDTSGPLFNSLWAISTTASFSLAQPIDLRVSNVLYAEWSPAARRLLAYSTAEKINRAPGWQANNDLWLLTWDDIFNRRLRRTETVLTPTQVLDTSSGGVFGWWGTGFAFAPDGGRVAYARTDSIGLVDLTTFGRQELTTFTAYNSRSDWAWYPSVRWSPQGDFLYAVTHGRPLGLEAPEDSPIFNLTALSTLDWQVDLVPRAGMFANPAPSPVLDSDSAEAPYRLAFLQAVEPNNSPFSRYRLGVMDRDGSNVRLVFPPEDQPGLEANARLAWSPDGRLLALIYEANLWLVEPETGVAQQITGDGLSDRLAWSR